MEAFPHHYTVTAQGSSTTSHISVSSKGVSDITTDAPAEFGGPGDQWSPEALIMAAVADCFVLTFRAIARASKLEWDNIQCQATGTLDRIERTTQFTEITLEVSLKALGDVRQDQVERILHKAEEGCLITNSMTAKVTLNTDISIG